MQADDVFRQQLLGVIPRLRRYARSLVFDAAAADDLVQTTLERALAHWHQFDQRRDLLVWVLSIAHNAHLDQRRRDARLSVLDLGPAVGANLEFLSARWRCRLQVADLWRSAGTHRLADPEADPAALFASCCLSTPPRRSTSSSPGTCSTTSAATRSARSPSTWRPPAGPAGASSRWCSPAARSPASR